MITQLEAFFHDWLGLGQAEKSVKLSGQLRSFAELLCSFKVEEAFTDTDALQAPVDELFNSEARRLGLKPSPFWPEEKPYAFCSTHDIDRILSSYHGLRGASDHPLQSLKRVIKDLPTLLSRESWKNNPFFNFSRASEMQSELGVRAAYYVLFEKRRILKSLMSHEIQHAIGVYDPKDIQDELLGLSRSHHEVGIHASFDAWSGDGAGAEKLKEERSALSALGLPLASGVRNHYLNYDPKRTPHSQLQAGFLYDSTYGFNSKNGFRAGTCFPYRTSGIWELPFQVMDSALRVQSRDPKAQRAIAFQALDQVRRFGGVFVLNWHLHTLNEEIFPDQCLIYRELVSAARKDGAWIAPPHEVIDWWARRVNA